MKRQILSLATALVLTTAGAVFAQSSLNTPAPGPSQETKPGQTNNNLQNPGSQMQRPATPPASENGTATTTTTTTAPPTDTTAPPADNTTGTMNNDTTGTMNNDQTGTSLAPPAVPPTTTTTTGNSTDTSSVSTSTGTQSLPKTASDLPTVALLGLLALSGFFAVRVYAKRNA
ncbi:MAG TPA: hypothetical protein VF173_01500 [Thermoanaerobaculia bacterium]|nr:hypothetical protein [Thermoanaerobaculia bacterium]